MCLNNIGAFINDLDLLLMSLVAILGLYFNVTERMMHLSNILDWIIHQ